MSKLRPRGLPPGQVVEKLVFERLLAKKLNCLKSVTVRNDPAYLIKYMVCQKCPLKNSYVAWELSGVSLNPDVLFYWVFFNFP